MVCGWVGSRGAIIININIEQVGSIVMPAVTVCVSLPLEILKLVEEVMEREKMNRSNAIAYLIKMGYVYRYRVLAERFGEGGEG